MTVSPTAVIAAFAPSASASAPTGLGGALPTGLFATTSCQSATKPAATAALA